MINYLRGRGKEIGHDPKRHGRTGLDRIKLTWMEQQQRRKSISYADAG